MFAAPAHVVKRREQLKRLPPDPYTIGSNHARRGNHEAAIAQFSRLIDTGRRTDADIFACRGASAQALGDHVRAVYDYSMAIRLQRDEPSHYTARAVSLAELHQIETLPGALRDHDTAVELVARDANALPQAVAGVHLARGLALEAVGRLSEAVDDLSMALGNLSDDDVAEVGGALVRRGSCLRQLERIEESLVDLREAVLREPNVAWHRLQLSQTLCAPRPAAGGREGQRVRVKRTISMYILPRRAWHPTSHIRCASGLLAEAEAELMIAIRMRGQDGTLRTELAKVLRPGPWTLDPR